MSKEQQSKVLAYIKTLLKTPQSSGHDLLRFAGSIDKAEVEKIALLLKQGVKTSIEPNR